MIDIPGFPTLNVTEEHKAAAVQLVQSLKGANPQAEGFLQKIHDAVERGDEAMAHLALGVLLIVGASFL